MDTDVLNMMKLFLIMQNSTKIVNTLIEHTLVGMYFIVQSVLNKVNNVSYRQYQCKLLYLLATNIMANYIPVLAR